MTILASHTSDHGPGPPYMPKMYTTVLVDHGSRVDGHGKRYYIRFETNAASKTWVTDKKAKELIEKWS